jgi:hypothetical protein
LSVVEPLAGRWPAGGHDPRAARGGYGSFGWAARASGTFRHLAASIDPRAEPARGNVMGHLQKEHDALVAK